MSIVELPYPQPISATNAPVRSFASTPSSAGIQSRYQVRGVTVSEDAIGDRVESRIVLVPANAFAGLECLRDLRLVGEERLSHAEESAHVQLASHRPPVAERARRAASNRSRRRIVGQISGRGLIREPLTDVTFVRLGSVGELARGRRSVAGQRLVESEPVADQHRRCRHDGADVVQEASDRGFELRGVDREVRC